MRTVKLSEKQNNLKYLLNLIKPQKPQQSNLPTIIQSQQPYITHRIKTQKTLSKIFINQQQALVWIKKDFDRKTKHDMLQMIRKKAEQELTIQKINDLKKKQPTTKRNYSHALRKYSTTSRCLKDLKDTLHNRKIHENKQRLFHTLNDTSISSQPKNKPFLNIRVVQIPKPPLKLNSLIKQKVHIQKQKIRNQTIQNENIAKQKQKQKQTQRQRWNQINKQMHKQKQMQNERQMQKISLFGRRKPYKPYKIRSQIKFKQRMMSQQDSFNDQLLSPW